MRAFMLVLMFLAACTQTPVPRENSDVVFSGPVYRLNVARIDVVDEYQSSRMLPHVELLASPSPAETVKRWSDTHLVAGGGTGYAEVVVKDAHILRKNLPKQKTGIEGYFTNEQTEEYDGQLEVTLKIYDGTRILPVATVDAMSRSMRTLGEDASLEDHKNTYHDISTELIKSLEPELDKNISDNFGKYLLN